MKKLYAIMCLSLILSVITHVSFANEKGKEVKTELSIDVPNDSCNVSVVDYSTVIVVTVENTDTNEVLYGFTPTGYLIFKNQPAGLFGYGLHRITGSNDSLTTTSLNHNNTFGIAAEPYFSYYVHRIRLEATKLLYRTPYVDKSYVWRYSIKHNC